MPFDESTARDLNPTAEESTANALHSNHDGAQQETHGTQNFTRETTTLNIETPEATALATETENSQSTSQARPEHAGSESQEMDFAAALESFEAEQSAAEAAAPAEDNLQKGTVVKLTDKYAVVDIGSKSEGMVPIAQVMGRDGQPKFKPGDSIDVVIDRGETEEGYLLLSHEKAQRARVWDDIEKAYNEKSPIKGYVVDRVKGGLSVDVGGVRAFLPGSQVDLKPVRNLDAFKGQELDVRIIKLNKKRGNIVVSRKQLLEEDQAEKRSKTLEHLEEGAVLTGSVKNLTDYGAFVDLGGLDGLLHITDMSWGRLTHPRDLVNVGDEIHVKVLKFDKDKQRVSLGFKQLTPDPWLDAAERYPVGAHVRGRVLSVTDYGAFIELEQGIEGLVHVSEMTWSKRMKHPSKIVKPADEVETVVLNVNPGERRISLGLKQLEQNPWEQLHEKYPVGSVVEGRVRNLTDFGAFIEIEDGIDGLVHVSNLSWTKRVKHPSEVLKKGEKVKAQVLAIEPDHRRLSLGIKQMQPDVWETFFDTHRIGDVVHGKVLRNAQFGAFVEIADGVEGLCHNSEATDSNGAPMKLEPGQEHDFKIIKMNQDEKKVGLSLRAVGHEASRADVEAYKQPVSSSTTTLGEIMNWKRASNDQD
ncbi:MAG: 30S ribosomal protein S1 [Acidobacteria bacterium]|nr:30S ribosomal protein S1 [Acidobacteriota bacterium]MBV9146302.1 30S ribosomal protein S1 [Acidobacteriota bacterium]MBV9434456.1 30S ribosomal protein S1 [Acidobacteriota bacterium]